MNLNSLQFGMAQRIFLNGNPLTQASATNLAVPTYLNQEGINLDLTKPVGTNKALIQFDSFELGNFTNVLAKPILTRLTEHNRIHFFSCQGICKIA